MLAATGTAAMRTTYENHQVLSFTIRFFCVFFKYRKWNNAFTWQNKHLTLRLVQDQLPGCDNHHVLLSSMPETSINNHQQKPNIN